ncbi:MAG: ComF family protein [Cetobacterium sp.]
MLKQLLRKILFDNSCSLCKDRLKGDSYICLKCHHKLEQMSFLKNWDNFYFLYYYSDIKNMIFDFKFKNRKDISKNLKKYVEPSIKKIVIDEEIDVIISTPVSKSRFLERGYNQVDELLIASNIKFDKIKRVKNTKYMYKIKASNEREKNVKNAFNIEQDYSGKNILIVDDIVTTGSTLRELERELREKHRVEKIVFFTLAAVRKYFK